MALGWLTASLSLSSRYLLCTGHLPVPAAGRGHAEHLPDSAAHEDPARLQHPDPRAVLFLLHRHPRARPAPGPPAPQPQPRCPGEELTGTLRPATSPRNPLPVLPGPTGTRQSCRGSGAGAGSCPSSAISTAVELCLIQTKQWWRTWWEGALAPLCSISVGGSVVRGGGFSSF